MKSIFDTLHFRKKSIFKVIDDISRLEIKKDPFSKVMVHLDPGHGIETPGKRTPYLCSGVHPKLELYEWQFNRDITNIVKNNLIELGFNVNVICDGDNDIPLSERANIANKKKNENPHMEHVFISIHANAYKDGSSWESPNGWSIYTTYGQNGSDKLANSIFDVAKEILPKYNISVRSDYGDGDPDYEDNFTVIKKANMPAVLVENLFYTNIKDTEFMLSENGKKVLSDIIVKGLCKYFV